MNDVAVIGDKDSAEVAALRSEAELTKPRKVKPMNGHYLECRFCNKSGGTLQKDDKGYFHARCKNKGVV
jgi:hypothetical protein